MWLVYLQVLYIRKNQREYTEWREKESRYTSHNVENRITNIKLYLQNSSVTPISIIPAMKSTQELLVIGTTPLVNIRGARSDKLKDCKDRNLVDLDFVP
jgi:hypothetical protein